MDEVPLFRGPPSGESVLLRGSGSRSGEVGGLMLVTSYGSTSLVAGGGDPDGEVALLPRDCGRDESKELDEELVLSDGARSPGGVPVLDEAAGSTIVGFAF